MIQAAKYEVVGLGRGLTIFDERKHSTYRDTGSLVFLYLDVGFIFAIPSIKPWKPQLSALFTKFSVQWRSLQQLIETETETLQNI